MQVASCPWCKSPLLDATSTQVCAACGRISHSITPTLSAIPPSSETPDPGPNVIPKTFHPGAQDHPHRFPFTLSHFSPLRIPWPGWGNHHQFQKRENFAVRRAFSIPLTLDPLEDEVPFTDPLQDETPEEHDPSQIRPNGQLTWQKVVEPSPNRDSYIYPPRPTVPENKHTVLPSPGVVSQSPFTLQTFKQSTISRIKHTSPQMIFWISTAILCLCVGLFGITSTFGRTVTNGNARPTFQITPSTLSVGATMTLRGDNFSPHAFIGLRRDDAIPLVDSSNARFTRADMTGHFTDTIIVGDDWGNGSHLITVEDSLSHKVASFPISIDGAGVSLRPPHLHLSVNTLDFGSGDQATNSTKKLTLSNTGSSQITWQASADQNWLLITPTGGTFTRDMPQNVTVAVDRSKIPTGSYSAKLHFFSSGGDEYLSVSAKVVPLQPEHTCCPLLYCNRWQQYGQIPADYHSEFGWAGHELGCVSRCALAHGFTVISINRTR